MGGCGFDDAVRIAKRRSSIVDQRGLSHWHWVYRDRYLSRRTSLNRSSYWGAVPVVESIRAAVEQILWTTARLADATGLVDGSDCLTSLPCQRNTQSGRALASELGPCSMDDNAGDVDLPNHPSGDESLVQEAHQTSRTGRSR